MTWILWRHARCEGRTTCWQRCQGRCSCEWRVLLRISTTDTLEKHRKVSESDKQIRVVLRCDYRVYSYAFQACMHSTKYYIVLHYQIPHQHEWRSDYFQGILTSSIICDPTWSSCQSNTNDRGTYIYVHARCSPRHTRWKNIWSWSISNIDKTRLPKPEQTSANKTRSLSANFKRIQTSDQHQPIQKHVMLC